MERDCILIIPDKFRGTLSSRVAGEAIAAGFREVWGERYHYLIRPMADGGEGTADIIADMEIIETAKFIGHQNACLLQRSILDRSSFLLGIALNQAMANNETVTVAIGGTVTADGGAGMLAALGARFLDHRRRLIIDPCPATILDVASIDLQPIKHLRKRITALCDVSATLTGPGLSALDFLKQKGATSEEAAVICRSLRHLHNILGGASAYDGAGGGIGYALCSVLGCKGILGADFILDRFDVDWKRIALIATGEGSIDKQSISGKLVGRILQRCTVSSIPGVAFGGKVDAELESERYIPVTPPGYLPGPDEARQLLRMAAAEFARKNMLEV